MIDITLWIKKNPSSLDAPRISAMISIGILPDFGERGAIAAADSSMEYVADAHTHCLMHAPIHNPFSAIDGYSERRTVMVRTQTASRLYNRGQKFGMQRKIMAESETNYRFWLSIPRFLIYSPLKTMISLLKLQW